MTAVAFMKNSLIVPFDENLALLAADISRQSGLAMADSIIYATGVNHKCQIITADGDFDGLPDVTYIPKN